MKKEHAERFSQDVERYRRALVYFAKQCDWEAFKERAEGLFEYCERVEAVELERKFFRLFSGILFMLLAAAVAVVSIDPRITTFWAEHRQLVLLFSLAGCGFEIFFYVNFRQYAAVRAAGLMRRREAFIQSLEREFRSFMNPSQSARA